MNKISEMSCVDKKVSEAVNNVTIGNFTTVFDGVKLGENVEIGCNCVLYPGVSVGKGTKIGDNCVLKPGTGKQIVIGQNNDIQSMVAIAGQVTIGNDNIIRSFCRIGYGPNDMGDPEYKDGSVVIGNHNHLDRCKVDRGEANDKWGSVTRIFDNCFIMDSIINHNCQVGGGDHIPDNPARPYQTVLSNGVVLNGFVTVEKGANLGSGTQVHQWRWVGAYAMTGMNTTVVKDILPGALSKKDRVFRVNKRPLTEAFGLLAHDLLEVEVTLRICCLKHLSGQALKEIGDSETVLAASSPAMLQYLKVLTAFLSNPRNSEKLCKWFKE